MPCSYDATARRVCPCAGAAGWHQEFHGKVGPLNGRWTACEVIWSGESPLAAVVVAESTQELAAGHCLYTLTAIQRAARSKFHVSAKVTSSAPDSRIRRVDCAETSAR